MRLRRPLARFLAMRHLGNRANVVLVRAATAANRLQAAVIRAFFELHWKRAAKVSLQVRQEPVNFAERGQGEPRGYDSMKLQTKPDNLVVITGAGGFIGGHLVKYFFDKGFKRIRAVDKKPLDQWYQLHIAAENLCLDCSKEDVCEQVCEGATEVYNLSADMGGMGFIERFRVECLRSILINTHMIEAAYRAGVQRYFYSSSACVYNTQLQQDPDVLALKESDAYPAVAERGYGWEKLISEMFCQEYYAERGMKTFIARFHNVYGPFGTWDGGREKAPAAK
jgi:NAD-dependent epimerase/dehydratase family protein